MKYNKCKFKKFKFFNQNINKENIIKILKSCYLNNSFSTFPYICDNCDSENAITNHNSANCIGLSIYIKFIDKNSVKISLFNNEIFNGNHINLSFIEENILNPLTYKYFKKM